MADPRKLSTFARNHGALWYRSRGYRFAWLALPQALGALVLSVFFMGGGVGDLSFKGAPPADDKLTGDWAKPLDTTEAEDALNTLRDAAGQGDEAALAELQAVADTGDVLAAFKLGTLYTPYFANYYPFPAQKDAGRAITLLEPSAKAGFWKAQGALGEIYLREPKPLRNMAEGCKNLIAYVNSPDGEKYGWGPDDLHQMVNGANCLLNEFRDDGVAFTEPSKEAAEQALTLLEDSLLANDTLALWSRVKALSRDTSPVFDRKRACPAAEAWVNATTPETRKPDDMYIISFLSLCLVGEFEEPRIAPIKAKHQAAITLLSAPELQTDADAQANLAWIALRPWDARDAAIGCKAAETWVNLVGTDPAQISRQHPLTAVLFADCLLGFVPGQIPRTATDKDLPMITALADHAIAKDHPEGDYMMGKVYRFGQAGAVQNGPKAVAHFERCAAKLPDCNRYLGDIFAYALIGFEKDNVKAAKHYGLCAEAGLVNCDSQLANIYRFDSSFDVADEVVIGHMRKAAEGGESLAAENLAYCYYEGTFGLKQNMETAAGWLIKSMTMSGGQGVIDWLANNADNLDQPDFWVEMHRELTRLGVYSGKASTKPSPETIAALYKLK